MSFTLEGPVLEGTLVRLEPLDHRHAADLAVAAEEDRSSYGFTWVPTAAEVGQYIDAQLARAATGRLAPYAQVAKSSGRAVGATAYWEPRLWPAADDLCAIEGGFTWLAKSAKARDWRSSPSCFCSAMHLKAGSGSESIWRRQR